MPEAFKGWSIDHKIPVALILALALQGAAGIWWGSNISATLADHGRELERLKVAEVARMHDDRRVAGRLGRIEGGLDEMTRTLARIEGRLTPDRSGQ